MHRSYPLLYVIAMLALACSQAHAPHAPPTMSEPLRSADASVDSTPIPVAARDAGSPSQADAALSGETADAAQRSVLCQPSLGGPYAVLEGETVKLTVECSTPNAERGELSFEALPDGALFDSATATFTWTPALAQAGRYDLSVRDASSGETGALRIDVVDRFNAPDNQPVDAARYHEEYGLPVIHVNTDPGVNHDAYTPATIVYRGHTYAGAEAKLRGASSQSFPKRSFTLKFTKADKFNEPDFAGGFLEKRKVTLTTTFDDNSYLRQRLGYELWNRLDPSHIRVQAYNAVLFLNGSYFGLYTVTDHIDGHLMEDFGHNQDGDLYKARAVDANFRATLNASDMLKENLHVGYTKEEGFPEPEQPGAFDNLDALVKWVIDSPAAQLAAETPARIAETDYVDWWIFVSFIAADDSIGKNSYHYRDPLLEGSVWHVVPWDLNHSFGQDWKTQRVSPMVTQPEGFYPQLNNLFQKLLAGPLAPAMRRRYAEVLANEAYTLERIMALYDRMAAEINTAARRDQLLWGDRYKSFGRWSTRTDFTDHDQEVAYVRDWIRARHAYLQKLYAPERLSR